MADPLSITASVFGIVGPALHGIRILIKDIKYIKNAPETLRNLLTGLQVVEKALESINDIEEEQWKSLGKATVGFVTTTITKTYETCEEFKNDLEKWPADGKISLWDKGTLGFWKKGDMEDMSKQLHTCQSTITSVTSTATLHSSLKNAQTTKEIGKMVSTSQGNINTSLTTVDQRLAEIERHLKEHRPAEASPKQGAGSVSVQASREREELEAARQVLKCLLAQIQKVVDETKKNKADDRDSYNISFGHKNAGMQLGVNEGTISRFRFGGT
ncbi:hypothetical protein NW761_014794 [Fusarium oxysporum]|uniref:Azaphilone pigments biosynthesis cluster protein L N-terminal domain-containing protein n=1 Tax=Fusarium oxysporum TaxID=5507 RepID=A0A8H5EKK9_FUSOX|nr:hypothetical protein FOXYS1_5012 [Fusarium oxysporum]KAJ4020342.1 hypothetical protein NW758_014904 [Fusarium oxysporum]KAJ4072576.1 hypothetical protein NW761_014794 [Fusarium oxysporum]WKT53590.1 hypothetical protein QSH57_004152 [Fusarium oxysporum f. sp. vasinfectum]